MPAAAALAVVNTSSAIDGEPGAEQRRAQVAHGQQTPLSSAVSGAPAFTSLAFALLVVLFIAFSSGAFSIRVDVPFSGCDRGRFADTAQTGAPTTSCDDRPTTARADN